MELHLLHPLVPVSRAQTIEEIQRVDVKTHVRWQLLLFDCKAAGLDLAVADGLLQTLEDCCEVFDIRSILAGGEE